MRVDVLVVPCDAFDGDLVSRDLQDWAARVGVDDLEVAESD